MIDDFDLEAAIESLEKEKELKNVDSLGFEGEGSLDTLTRIFDDSLFTFVSPLSIPEEFLSEILQGRKTPFITERHFDIMSQYNWDFMFGELIEKKNSLTGDDFNKRIFDFVKNTPSISIGGSYF